MPNFDLLSCRALALFLVPPTSFLPFKNSPPVFLGCSSPLQPQPSPHALPHDALKFWSPLAPHLGGLDISRTLVIGLGQHAHDTDEDFFCALDGTPALARLFVVVRVVPRSVQDADADLAVGVDVGVEDFAQEAHGGRGERVVWRESESGGEQSARVGCGGGPGDEGFPQEQVRFGNWSRGDAVRWGGSEVLVFVK